MFPCDGSRKRPRIHNGASPLSQTVICLSGFSPETKERYHSLIEQLGGRYSRDFTSNNTHLITDEPIGAKYEAALLLSQSVWMVRSSWLEACLEAGRRLPETDHLLLPEDAVDASILPANNGRGVTLQQANSNNGGTAGALARQNWTEQLATLLNEENPSQECSVLFSDCRLFLVGFDDKERHSLGRLIRRGMGFIQWDCQVQVPTHVVVRCDAALRVRETLKSLTQQFHENSPVIVSSSWVMDSWEANELLCPFQYPPTFLATPASVKENVNTINHSADKKPSTLFKGQLFCLIRVVPPDFAVDFDSVAIEKSIRVNGGQILSDRLVEALVADARDAERSGLTVSKTNKRRLYVVCWGGAFETSHLEMQPLLTQVKRQQLCSVVQVTPIWLQTCVSTATIISPRHMTTLFSPESTSYPWHALKKSTRIAISGFSGWRRSALIHFLDAVAVYDDSMTRHRTTHLIVEHAQGEKYAKAKEWGLHIASPEWLYHVVQFGYHGKSTDQDGKHHKLLSDSSSGCEELFPPQPASTELSM